MNADRKHKRETITQYLKLMEQFGLREEYKKDSTILTLRKFDSH